MDVKNISVDLLLEAPMNPQEQTATTFNNLKKEIQQEGFDQPIIVIPHPSVEGKYMAVSGNHRLRAMKELGEQEVPCVIKHWDLTTAKLKLVQRNKMSGEINTLKLQELVDDVYNETRMALPEIATGMGYEDYAAFAEEMALNQQTFEESRQRAIEDSESGTHKTLVDSLYTVVQDIIEEYGDSIGDSYIWFVYRGKKHLIVDLSPESKASLEKLTDLCGVDDANINAVLPEVIERGLWTTDADGDLDDEDFGELLDDGE